MNNTINAAMLKKAFVAGALNLDKNKEYINELNVFPVPDGDTGTNMTLTILSAKREVEAVSDSDMSGIARAMSTGSLRGARGNSGVILSQLLRGFSKKIADEKELDVHVIADAFQKSVETAYKAVMKPKEGTPMLMCPLSSSVKMLLPMVMRSLTGLPRCFLYLRRRVLWIPVERDLWLSFREPLMPLQERLLWMRP